MSDNLFGDHEVGMSGAEWRQKAVDDYVAARSAPVAQNMSDEMAPQGGGGSNFWNNARDVAGGLHSIAGAGLKGTKDHVLSDQFNISPTTMQAFANFGKQAGYTNAKGDGGVFGRSEINRKHDFRPVGKEEGPGESEGAVVEAEEKPLGREGGSGEQTGHWSTLYPPVHIGDPSKAHSVITDKDDEPEDERPAMLPGGAKAGPGKPKYKVKDADLVGQAAARSAGANAGPGRGLNALFGK